MSIEQRVYTLLHEALVACRNAGLLQADPLPPIVLEVPKQAEHGDYASNLAMSLAHQEKKAPHIVAQTIIDHLPRDPLIRTVKIAGPGFLNFVVEPRGYLEILPQIAKEGARYGSVDIGKGRRCQIEFVSANPTGPLHVGHGRGAIYGDVLASLLTTAGYRVTREFYVNDAGVQMETLGRSVYLRLETLRGRSVAFPADGYQGAYITELARAILASPEAPRLQSLSEADQIRWCGAYAGKKILDEIREDLAACGVIHDRYFFETELREQHLIETVLEQLRASGTLYDQEGACWFRSTNYGDDKDRVVRKSDGSYTYFAADIAYHYSKFRQGYDRVIDIWGADHSGHVPRMKAAIAALGQSPEALDCILLQIVNLVRDGRVVSMSTRRAEYETLRALLNQVGRDVCRYFFLMRSHNAQLDFDMGLAMAQTMENPVYYIQYAHARICSIFAKAIDAGEWSHDAAEADLACLTLPEEYQLARFLGDYPQVIDVAARALEPHRVSFYLLDLARKFQAYYTGAKKDPRYRVLGHERATTTAKLYLLKNIQIVIQNALHLLGLHAPTRMERLDREGTDGELPS